MMPEKRSKREEDLYEKAREFSSENNYVGLLPIVKALSEMRPNSGILRAQLANTYDELGDIKLAEKMFYEAVELDPLHEIISLGLFLCLWDQDNRYDALEEMKRYQVLTNFKCKDYKEIMAEIKIKNKQETWESRSRIIMAVVDRRGPRPTLPTGGRYVCYWDVHVFFPHHRIWLAGFIVY